VDKPGHIAPIRRGLEETKGEIVAFLDDDTEPERGWLQALLEPFMDPKVACVGGRVITPNFRGKVHPDAGRIRWYGKHVGNIGALEAPAPVEVDGVPEGNCAWRVQILRQLDFDPVFDFDDASMYGLDLCLQAKALGYRVIYYSAARVVHHVAPRDPTLNRQDRPRRTFTYSRNYTYLAMKHFRGWRRISFMLWWWLIGERGSYGVVLSISNLILYSHKTWPILKASFIGKWIGTKIWLKNCRNKGR
jgi:GT2 family glycosyltransferase